MCGFECSRWYSILCVGVEAERLGLVIVVEDRRVHLAGDRVLGRKLVLDRPELQVAVRVADGLLELVSVVQREVLRGCVADRHELARAGSTMREHPVDDLAGVVPAGEEQDDLRLPGLDVQTGGVDGSPHVPGRLPEALQRLDLLVDLSSQLDDHRAGVIESEARCVADRMPLELPVQGGQQVVALVGDAPLVGVGHGHAPALVQGLEALEGRAGEVVHDDQHGARRPVVEDVAGANATAQDQPGAFGREDGPAEPAVAPLEDVAFGSEQRLTDDANDDLVAVSGHWPHCARGTDAADDAGGQVVDVLRGIDERIGAVAAVALWRIWLRRIRGGRRVIERGLARLLGSGGVCGSGGGPRRGLLVLLLGGLLSGLGPQALLARLGARDEHRYQPRDHRPVLCSECLAIDPRLQVMELLEGDVDACGHEALPPSTGHDGCTAHKRSRKFLTSG